MFSEFFQTFLEKWPLSKKHNKWWNIEIIKIEKQKEKKKVEKQKKNIYSRRISTKKGRSVERYDL